MRRLLLGCVTVGLLLGTFGLVKAGTRSTVEIDEGTREYWRTAQKLTNEQMVLLGRVEQSMPKANAKRLQVLRGQLLLHDSAIDRFLHTNHPDPKAVCGAGAGTVAGTDAATPEQLQVYCALFSSTRDLMVLRSRLDRQARLMAGQVGAGSSAIAMKPQKQSAIVNVPVSLAASSKEIMLLVQSSRHRLAQVQVAFPEAMRVSRSPQRAMSRQPQNSDSWK